jgi:hypothetical protein
MRSKVHIAIASNFEGPEIKALCVQAGYEEYCELEFNDVHPYWLVAKLENETGKIGPVIGAIQTLPGRPVGRLESLCYYPGLSDIDRTRVMAHLVSTGLATLKMDKATMASGMVAFSDKAFKRFLKKRGGKVLASGNIMAIGI